MHLCCHLCFPFQVCNTHFPDYGNVGLFFVSKFVILVYGEFNFRFQVWDSSLLIFVFVFVFPGCTTLIIDFKNRISYEIFLLLLNLKKKEIDMKILVDLV